MLRPSRRLAWFLFLVHGAALAALAALPLPPVATALLAAAILTSFIVEMRRHVLLRGSRAVKRLVWTASGGWILTGARGETFDAERLPGGWISPYALILNFRDERKRRYTVILLADNCAPDEHRKLRARLRLG